MTTTDGTNNEDGLNELARKAAKRSPAGKSAEMQPLICYLNRADMFPAY